MKILKSTLISGLSALALTACSGSDTSDTVATDTEVVQDDAMISDGTQATTDKNIVALAQGNPQASTLVTAVTAAGLAETLSGSGPFTLFAPSNDAFAKLDKATLDGLMMPASKAKLAALLKYHVVAGNVKAADLAKLIADGNGTATVTTLNGGTLKASMNGDKIVLTDAKGGKSTVTTADLVASNGTVHMVDTVVMP
ncbi:fasciclin domain-containing protein [Sphingorhabdus sp.]|jgi:uncharacterized surface protein with fasciclin (FAS1) repeats|uniref:fasciclin domain-containing protein n=1 Tax=Sphingorhabdus sp. TaxID=1902408 RepID=UPI0037CBF915